MPTSGTLEGQKGPKPMSRTDKDIPQWVAQRIVGRVEHDHRNGVCNGERKPRP